MGVIVHTTFQTSEGIDLQTVYVKIVNFTCDVVGSILRISIRSESFVSREKRLSGCRSVTVPNMSMVTVFETSTASEWNSLSALYSKVKSSLQTEGYTVEDVFESGQQSSA